MPIPEFIVALREKVGHAPLWLSGVSVVIRDDDGRVLLTRRADNGQWAVVSGVLEPGEEPSAAAVREAKEETGVDAELIRITSVDVTEPITYPNGDVTQYLDVCFLARVDRRRCTRGGRRKPRGRVVRAERIAFGHDGNLASAPRKSVAGQAGSVVSALTHSPIDDRSPIPACAGVGLRWVQGRSRNPSRRLRC